MARGKSKSRKTPKKYKGVKKFGLPKQKKYPLQPRGRAANAKGRAKQQLKRGRLSKSQYNQIVSRANKALGKRKRRKK